jgi:hypothetical protein
VYGQLVIESSVDLQPASGVEPERSLMSGSGTAVSERLVAADSGASGRDNSGTVDSGRPSTMERDNAEGSAEIPGVRIDHVSLARRVVGADDTGVVGQAGAVTDVRGKQFVNKGEEVDPEGLSYIGCAVNIEHQSVRSGGRSAAETSFSYGPESSGVSGPSVSACVRVGTVKDTMPKLQKIHNDAVSRRRAENRRFGRWNTLMWTLPK